MASVGWNIFLAFKLELLARRCSGILFPLLATHASLPLKVIHRLFDNLSLELPLGYATLVFSGMFFLHSGDTISGLVHKTLPNSVACILSTSPEHSQYGQGTCQLVSW